MFRRLLILMTALALALPVYGIAEVRQEKTEENGKVKRLQWTDTLTGGMTAGPEGYAVVEYSYSKQTVTERYYDTEMQPYRTAGGYYGKSVTTDGKKQVTQIEYLDQNGKRALNNDGYALVVMAYTSFGAVRNLHYYGLKGLKTVPSLGYASVITDFRGKTVTKRTWMNEAGKPVDTRAGYAVMIQKVNKKNQVLGISYEHADGTPATCEDGWSSCVKERDDKGRLLKTVYYNEAGRMTDRGAGYAWEAISYPSDNEQRITRYDTDGNKIADEDGVVTLKQELRDDRIVRESFLNGNGEYMLNGDGVGTIQYTYDHEGRIETVSFLNLNGESCLNRGGYAGYRDIRDENGATVTRIFTGTDGIAIETAEGYSEIRYTYDETGRLVSTRYYDLNGTQIRGE